MSLLPIPHNTVYPPFSIPKKRGLLDMTDGYMMNPMFLAGMGLLEANRPSLTPPNYAGTVMQNLLVGNTLNRQTKRDEIEEQKSDLMKKRMEQEIESQQQMDTWRKSYPGLLSEPGVTIDNDTGILNENQSHGLLGPDLYRWMANSPDTNIAIKGMTGLAEMNQPQKPVLMSPGSVYFDPNNRTPIYTAPFKQNERKIIQGADGFNYYADSGERVLPGVIKDQGYKTRDYSLDGGMVQPQELINGEWQDVGSPYNRRQQTIPVPTSPTRDDNKRAMEMIEDDPLLSDVQNKQELSFAVSSRAREIQKQQGVGSYDATRQAIEELKLMVEPGKTNYGIFGWDLLAKDSKPKFNPDYQEGATAINPNTGHRIKLKNGQWVDAESDKPLY